MNKKRIKELNKLFLNKKENVINISKTSIITKKDEQGDSSKRIALSIELESESPVYGSGEYKYKEIIENSAFDESLAEVKENKRTIYSFSDHKMDTQNILGSTANSNTELYKKGNTIHMEFDVDMEDPKSRKVYNLIKDGDIESNSFIFKMLDVEYIDVDPDEDPDGISFKVIVKRGELISIDPVVFAFYPQNKMQARDEAIADLFKKQKPTAGGKADEKETTNMRKMLLELIKKSMTKQKLEFKEEDFKDSTDAELFEKHTELAGAELRAKVEETLDTENQKRTMESFEKSTAELKELVLTKNQEERDAMARQIKTFKAEIAKSETKLTKKEAEVEFLFGDYWTAKSKEESIELLSRVAKSNAKVLKRYSEEELNLMNISNMEINKRDFTGADNDSGALVIPVFTSPEVIGEDTVALPEIEGARRIGIVGEAETKVPVDVAAGGKSTPIGIGEDSKKVSGNAVKVSMKPIINSEYFVYNPKMSAHVNEVPQITTNLMNRQRTEWRSSFAAGLLKHIAATFVSVKDTYDGGATKEAVVNSGTANVISLADLDAMTDGLVAKYGDRSKSIFKFYMNSKTWGGIKELVRKQANSVSVRIDMNAMTINGVKVITSDEFTQEVKTGDHPIILFKKSNVVVYGGTTVIRDSDQQAWLARNNSRQVTTYGEVKLCDPHYDTRVLEII